MGPSLCEEFSALLWCVQALCFHAALRLRAAREVAEDLDFVTKKKTDLLLCSLGSSRLAGLTLKPTRLAFARGTGQPTPVVLLLFGDVRKRPLSDRDKKELKHAKQEPFV